MESIFFAINVIQKYIKDIMVSNLILILLCVLPFGGFFFTKLDIWNGQGMFFQLGLLAIYAASFFFKANKVSVTNRPLGCILLWFGLVTSYYWVNVLIQSQHYAVKIFLPFFNFLCFVIFYKLCIEYLNAKKIEKVLKWMSYSVFIVLLYCVLQIFNLDQFYRPIGMIDRFKGDHLVLVGTIGNSSHLAGYLALCQPLFFNKGFFNYISLFLLWVVMILANSASGVIVGLAVIIFWSWFKGYKKSTVSIILLCLIGTIIAYKFDRNFFTSSHRIEAWKMFYDKFQLRPITGQGLGILNAWKALLDTSVWNHVHNEYFQVAIETGVIGLGLVLWGIVDYFRRFRKFRTNLSIKLFSMFFGFCLLALVNFNTHLWLLASIGMISYSFMFVLENERLNNGY